MEEFKLLFEILSGVAFPFLLLLMLINYLNAYPLNYVEGEILLSLGVAYAAALFF